MILETKVLTSKISVSFTYWAKGFDSPEVVAMHETNAIKTLYRDVNKDDPESVVVIHQEEKGFAKAF